MKKRKLLAGWIEHPTFCLQDRRSATEPSELTVTVTRPLNENFENKYFGLIFFAHFFFNFIFSKNSKTQELFFLLNGQEGLRLAATTRVGIKLHEHHGHKQAKRGREKDGHSHASSNFCKKKVFFFVQPKANQPARINKPVSSGSWLLYFDEPHE